MAIAFAKQGADVAIAYLNEHEDAKQTQQLIDTDFLWKERLRFKTDINCDNINKMEA